MGTGVSRIDYDFIEVGTSCFDTLIERASNVTVGLSIEPINRYLDMLPNKNRVTKIHAALISDEDYAINGDLDVYYVPDNVIWEHNLGYFMMGCNSVGKPHDFHVSWYPDPAKWHATEDKSTLDTINLMNLGLVKVEKVKCYTYAMLAEEFDIGKVTHLKTDTEGNDGKILKSVMNYYSLNNRLEDLPHSILFENNSHNKKEDIVETKKLLSSFGYNIVDNINDSLATLSNKKV